MPAFHYAALNEKGRRQKGVLEGDSARQVRQQLRDKGLVPLEVTEAAAKKNWSFLKQRATTGGISSQQLALVTRQLASLTEAAVPLEEALRATAEQSEKPRLKSLLLSVRAKILEGHDFAASLAAFPDAFPEFYRATVAAGEHSGHLDKVLLHLADYIENRQRSFQKIQLALLYPAILTVTSLCIIGFLLGYVFPGVVKTFVSAGQTLPFLTRLLITLSHFMQNFGLLILLIIAAAIFAFKRALKNPAFKLALDRRLFQLPGIGKLIITLNTARFANTLHILTSSGVPLVDALTISCAVLPNRYIRGRVQHVTQEVREGSSLRAALEKTQCFPPILLYMIASGEASGRLDEMLERAAKSQQQDLETRMAMLIGLFEPLMLLIMGGIVLLLVLAILLPILNLNQLVS